MPETLILAFDGKATYTFTRAEQHEVLASPGTFDEDWWPYRDYPTLLPYIPLTVIRRKKQTWRQFVAEFPKMKDEQPSELVVIVPPPMTIGVSVWGGDGDAEGVAMIFECDLKQKIVSTYNVCT
jgi:hypothetical protein